MTSPTFKRAEKKKVTLVVREMAVIVKTMAVQHCSLYVSNLDAKVSDKGVVADRGVWQVILRSVSLKKTEKNGVEVKKKQSYERKKCTGLLPKSKSKLPTFNCIIQY